jgi:hypothetical protein
MEPTQVTQPVQNQDDQTSKQTCPLTEPCCQQCYNIDIATIPYQDSYRLRSGSAAQLVRGVQSMLFRVSADKETDEYKKTLYPKLREVASKLVDRFTLMLKAANQKEQEVRKFNLCGYDGQVRPDRYGRYPFVKGVNPNTKYAFANFGYFIKMLRQRMEFITSREVPQRYVTDDDQRATFTTLRTEVTSFLEFLNTYVEPEWNAAVQAARVSGGVSVQQNLEQRLKSQAERKEQKEKNTVQYNKRVAKTRGSFKNYSSEKEVSNKPKYTGSENRERKRSNGGKRFAMPNWVKKTTNKGDN